MAVYFLNNDKVWNFRQKMSNFTYHLNNLCLQVVIVIHSRNGTSIFMPFVYTYVKYKTSRHACFATSEQNTGVYIYMYICIYIYMYISVFDWKIMQTVFWKIKNSCNFKDPNILCARIPMWMKVEKCIW